MARILVVDDEQNMGRAMRWELKGHDVRVVNTREDAFASLCQEKFDALICDWNLGEHETGERVLEAAAKLNAAARRFVVSGIVPDELASLLVAGVAHRYIAKPWRPHEVRDALTEELHG